MCGHVVPLQNIGQETSREENAWEMRHRWEDNIKIDQVKEDEMGRAGGAHWRDEKCIQGWSENLKRGDHLEALGIDWRILQ
jgi:hypothetical protein